MSFSLNRITLIGNLGKDAETKFTSSNIGVTSFTLATTSGYKGKDGNWVNETTWHNCTIFNASDFIKDYLKKGAKVYVEGRLKKEEYTDKDGVKRYNTKVMSERILPLTKEEHQGSAQEEHQEVKPETDNDLPF